MSFLNRDIGEAKNEFAYHWARFRDAFRAIEATFPDNKAAAELYLRFWKNDPYTIALYNKHRDDGVGEKTKADLLEELAKIATGATFGSSKEKIDAVKAYHAIRFGQDGATIDFLDNMANDRPPPRSDMAPKDEHAEE